ncbi:hypothetical protein GCM10027612_21910 [Microbispora bryophytorum subsp. camponoti]
MNVRLALRPSRAVLRPHGFTSRGFFRLSVSFRCSHGRRGPFTLASFNRNPLGSTAGADAWFASAAVAVTRAAGAAFA